MLNIVTTNQFKKDLKRIVRRGENINKIEKIVNTLQAEMDLETRYRNHQLQRFLLL